MRLELPPNHALQRTRHGVVDCNPCASWAGSLSLGRSAPSYEDYSKFVQ
jgi:hypothetical protein